MNLSGSKFKPAVYHIALIVYCVLIFVLSSIPGEDIPEVDFKYSDKFVHTVVYGVQFVLFFYSLKNQTKNVKLQKFAAEYSLLFTALYGITDEIHQYFIPGRSCEIYDWFADVSGALIMYLIFKFYSQSKRRAVVLFLLALIAGCSSQNDMSGNESVKTRITNQEAWLNLMPVVEKDRNNFGFLISVEVDDKFTKGEYDAGDLVIYLDNYTVRNKLFSKEISSSDGKVKISVSQLNEILYLDSSGEQPRDAIFEFQIYKNGKKIKKLKTKKLIINKVY